MNIYRTLIAGALLGAVALPAAAQIASGPSFSFEPAALYATVNGDDFAGTDAGFGFDVQGRVKFSALSLGVGYQRSSHDVESVTENIAASGFFIEPRYEFATPGPVTPYLSARVGRVTTSLESGGSEAEQSGFSFGGGAGIVMPLAKSVRLNTSATWNRVSLGNAKLNGSEIPDSESKGSSVMLRVGMSLNFGR
jgi:opacity protein-like surface antigen